MIIDYGYGVRKKRVYVCFQGQSKHTTLSQQVSMFTNSLISYLAPAVRAVSSMGGYHSNRSSGMVYSYHAQGVERATAVRRGQESI